MKNFTTKEQSEELLRLGLKEETADCFYNADGDCVVKTNGYTKSEGDTPCWSMGAIANVCNFNEVNKACLSDGWRVSSSFSSKTDKDLFAAFFGFLCWMLEHEYVNKLYQHKMAYKDNGNGTYERIIKY